MNETDSRELLEGELLRSGAYRDLDEPVIVTSGECLTPFYVNAEKLCGDPGVGEALERLGADDAGLLDYAAALARKPGGFRSCLKVIAELAAPFAPEAISGGQRRDWIFSGPIAERLGLPHVSLYKQAPGQPPEHDRVVVRLRDGSIGGGEWARGRRVVHVVDMITAASSCVSRDPVSGRETGWIPMLRARGAEVKGLLAVVSRRQGGEEALERAGVPARSLVLVDEAFLRRHSRRPDSACAYLRDPAGWTRGELRSRGVGLIARYLTDEPTKLPRLIKFLGRYGELMKETGMWSELDAAALARTGRSLDELTAARA